MALLPPAFLDCVVAVGAGSEDAKRWIASGFLYGRFARQLDKDTKQYNVYLVTNAHVLKDLPQVWLRFNPESDELPTDYVYQLLTNTGAPLWVAHPNPNIDVAVGSINIEFLRQHAMRVGFFSSDDHAMTVQQMADAGVSEGDFAFVLGFPLGLVGEKRMAVMVRGGPIARIRDALHEGLDTYFIDASVFPGNSGGPVVLRPELLSIQGTNAISKAMLIGIVRAYAPYRDEAVSKQTGMTRVVFEENSGLGAAHPMDMINEAIDEHNKRFPVPDSTIATGPRSDGSA